MNIEWRKRDASSVAQLEVDFFRNPDPRVFVFSFFLIHFEVLKQVDVICCTDFKAI